MILLNQKLCLLLNGVSTAKKASLYFKQGGIFANKK